MSLDDDAAEIAFGQPQRPLKDDAPDALCGKEVVGQHDPVASHRGVDLHILIQAKAEEVRDALAYLDHRERRASARFDDVDEVGVLNSGAFHLKPHFDDRLTDVISDGGFDGCCEQQQENKSARSADLRSADLQVGPAAASKLFPHPQIQRVAVVFITCEDPRDAICLIVFEQDDLIARRAEAAREGQVCAARDALAYREARRRVEAR